MASPTPLPLTRETLALAKIFQISSPTLLKKATEKKHRISL